MQRWRRWQWIWLMGFVVVAPVWTGLAMGRSPLGMATAGRARERRSPVYLGAYMPALQTPVPHATPGATVRPRRPALRIF
ncbi:MAG: hypothetical protein ACYCXG_10175 [Acidiferrobacter sp.]